MTDVRIDVKAYVRDRNWGGNYFDRDCLYEHQYDSTCPHCKAGKWMYTAPSKTGISPWGGKMDTENMYMDGHYWRHAHKEKKDLVKRVQTWMEKFPRE